MGSAASDLVVRGSDRYQCDLAATIAVAPVHARLIKPDAAAPGGGGPVDVRLVDLSRGGAGVRSPLFFPGGARLTLTLTPPGASSPLCVEVRVQRVMMLDRKPTYYLGTAFEGMTEQNSAIVTAMVQNLKASGAMAVPEKSRA